MAPFMWGWVLVGVAACLGSEMVLAPFMCDVKKKRNIKDTVPEKHKCVKMIANGARARVLTLSDSGKLKGPV